MPRCCEVRPLTKPYDCSIAHFKTQITTSTIRQHEANSSVKRCRSVTSSCVSFDASSFFMCMENGLLWTEMFVSWKNSWDEVKWNVK